MVVLRLFREIGFGVLHESISSIETELRKILVGGGIHVGGMWVRHAT